jgi:hypothetical protein
MKRPVMKARPTLRPLQGTPTVNPRLQTNMQLPQAPVGDPARGPGMQLPPSQGFLPQGYQPTFGGGGQQGQMNFNNQGFQGQIQPLPDQGFQGQGFNSFPNAGNVNPPVMESAPRAQNQQGRFSNFRDLAAANGTPNLDRNSQQAIQLRRQNRMPKQGSGILSQPPSAVSKMRGY